MSVDLDGIDTINKALILTIFFSILIELSYLGFPAGMKKIVENQDFKKGIHTFSYTGCTSMTFALLVILTKANQLNQSMSSDERATLSIQEKSFRNRQKF